MKLILSKGVAEKLSLYVAECPGEVSGLGEVELVGGDVRVTKLHLLKQVATQAATDLDQGAVAELMCDLLRKGVDTGNLRLWWHSHGGMDTFWSTTDDKTCGMLSGAWMVAVVTNKQGKFLARMELREPFNLSAEVGVSIDRETDPTLLAEVKAEVAAKVRKPVYVTERKQKGKLKQGIMGLVPSHWVDARWEYEELDRMLYKRELEGLEGV